MLEEIESREECLVWPRELSGYTGAKRLKNDKMTVIDSDRVGVKYSFDQSIEKLMNKKFEKYKECIKDQQKLEKGEHYEELQFRSRLTTAILKFSQNRKEPVQITNDILEEARTGSGMTPRDRAEQLLIYFSSIALRISDLISISDNSLQFYKAMARSESLNREDMFYLCDYLVQNNFLEKVGSEVTGRLGPYRITVEGYDYLNQAT